MFSHRFRYFPMFTQIMLLPQKLLLPVLLNNPISSHTHGRKLSLNLDAIRKDDIKFSGGGLLVIQGLIDYQWLGSRYQSFLTRQYECCNANRAKLQQTWVRHTKKAYGQAKPDCKHFAFRISLVQQLNARIFISRSIPMSLEVLVYFQDFRVRKDRGDYEQAKRFSTT